MVRYELLLLTELGFGLDLERCAVTGANDQLVAVSPIREGGQRGRGGAICRGKLLPLPAFLREGGRASWEDIVLGLGLTGHFLLRDIVTERLSPVSEARARLVERLMRAGGLA